MIRHAMILAAGLGTRLKPITQTLPKPLIPIANIPNIVHSIDLLKRAKIFDITINLHHLAHQIRELLDDGSKFGVNLNYSSETTLLGTGGGVKNAERFFLKNPVVVINCDFISNIDLGPHIKRHFQRSALATMVLVPDRGPDYNPVFIAGSGQLTGIGQCAAPTDSRTTFTGIHILSAEALDALRPEFSDINQVLYPSAMSRGLAYGDVTSATWEETGDAKNLYRATLSLMNDLSTSTGCAAALKLYLDYQEKQPGVWVPSGCTLPDEVRFLGPCIVGNPTALAGGSRIGPDVVLSPETTITRAITLSNFVSIGRNEISTSVESALYFDSVPIVEKKGLGGRT